MDRFYEVMALRIGHFLLKVVRLVLEWFVAVRAVVEAGHAAELEKTAATDVLLDSLHQEVVGGVLQPQVGGAPGVSTSRTLDLRHKTS